MRKRKPRVEVAPIFVVGVLVAGIASMAWSLFPSSGGPGVVSVRVPQLSAYATAGKKAFEANCAACHGAAGGGTDQGPPLVHDIYNPGHHSDEAFFFAAKYGSPQHHWRFGDMPPQPQVKGEDVAAIVRYIRELQQANGIVYKPHRM